MIPCATGSKADACVGRVPVDLGCREQPPEGKGGDVIEGRGRGVELEAGDIVQGSFVDTYFNNTVKTGLGFGWAVEHCPKVGGGAKEAETLVKFCQVLFGTISHIYFFPASEILPMKNVNTIPHRLAVHVYFYYVYLDVVHEGFESVILLVLQIILVPLNSISSAFLVSRCKGSPYFRRKKMCEIFNHYSTGLFTCLVSIRSHRQETLKNSCTLHRNHRCCIYAGDGDCNKCFMSFQQMSHKSYYNCPN